MSVTTMQEQRSILILRRAADRTDIFGGLVDGYGTIAIDCKAPNEVLDAIEELLAWTCEQDGVIELDGDSYEWRLAMPVNVWCEHGECDDDVWCASLGYPRDREYRMEVLEATCWAEARREADELFSNNTKGTVS